MEILRRIIFMTSEIVSDANGMVVTVLFDEWDQPMFMENIILSRVVVVVAENTASSLEDILSGVTGWQLIGYSWQNLSISVKNNIDSDHGLNLVPNNEH